MENRRQSTAPTLGLIPPNQTPGMGGGGGGAVRKQSVMMMDISQLSPSARKQSMMIANGQITIKLSKTSTARPFLRNKEHRDGLLTRLADIIEDGNAQQRKGELETKGKLPIEAAYKVMKRITEAAKIPVLPAGMSTFNKLESLRTDPAVKVLQSTTWKEFFSKPKPGHNDSKAGLNAHSLYSSIQATPSQLAGGSSSHAGDKVGETTAGDILDMEEDDPMLDILFENLILRVNTLWKEVKIPQKEQQFYRKSLCKRPIQNIEQCKELAGYIEKLEEHKFLIKQVLKQIQIREIALKKAYDVLVALHRKFASTSTSSSKSMNIAGNVFWKEELILSLDEVRCASLEVIKHIQLWRRMMWRPHAFFYKGVNYLLKMKEDMKLLESEVFRKVLEQVPLQMEDLQCVIFNVNYQHGNSNAQHYNRYGGGYRSKSFRSQYPPDSPEAYMENLVNDFQSNIERDELQAASAVVLEEEMLQQALTTEKEALQLKGVFIPLLRPNSNSSSQQNNNNNTNTTISTQPSQPRHTPYHPPYNASATPSSFTPYHPQPSPSTPYQSAPNNYQNNQQPQVSSYAPYNNTGSSYVHQTTPFHTSKSLNSQESFRNLQRETIEEQEEHEEDAPVKKSPVDNKEEIDDHDENKPNAKEVSPRPVRHAQDEPEVSVEPSARVPMDELAP